jgi:hypothetical protein
MSADDLLVLDARGTHIKIPLAFAIKSGKFREYKSSEPYYLDYEPKLVYNLCEYLTSGNFNDSLHGICKDLLIGTPTESKYERLLIEELAAFIDYGFPYFIFKGIYRANGNIYRVTFRNNLQKHKGSWYLTGMLSVDFCYKLEVMRNGHWVTIADIGTKPMWANTREVSKMLLNFGSCCSTSIEFNEHIWQIANNGHVDIIFSTIFDKYKDIIAS